MQEANHHRFRYLHLFVAGTFDGLHAGHRAVLTRAFEKGERVTIGLTTDSFVNKFKIFKFQISNFQTRKQRLIQFLKQNGWNDRTAIIPINDPYEPAASMKDVDAIIVTSENRARGERINALRQGATLPQLTLIEVPMVAAADGKPISSTRLRNMEIDGNGRLIMPESMRTVLRKPLGRVLKRFHPAQRGETFIVTVGDIATKTFLDAGVRPFLAIIDGKVGRKPFPEVVDRLQPRRVRPFEAKSGPGYISREAREAIEYCFTHSPVNPFTHHSIIIDGEEDLLVLPAVIHAPLGAIVYYGQPNEGLVEVVVTEEKKKQVVALFGKFT
ncbi:pantetheine-phosphate adenylyltransferase [Candidatus Gottesmanbacteria bacterium]|nr:pantetheine-phosphate adenylyltransferase [Candidatus Gottesmanbacteria bacterium]